ncbi:hypothetical protein HMPREF2531_00697 [Bacteroides intestinalis]|uniref:Uncharacterized protein n=1 Tax=Bacteroides intestinalis TaxID=329854 RepID=A0A139LSX6_9BACE|nr:hypothetical protein HMPREF2531_00697 [Bacteroides intestinalis]
MDFRQKKTTGSTRLKANFEEEIKKNIIFCLHIREKYYFCHEIKNKKKTKV